MKALLSIALYGTLILFSTSMAGYGVYSMFSDVINGGDLGRGFMFFSLGMLIVGVAAILYTLGVIIENLKRVNENLILQMQGNQNPGQGQNPLVDFMNQFKDKMTEDGGEFPLSGSMTIAKMNDDGSITPIEKREFNSPEELKNLKEEMLKKVFAKKDKKFEDMSIQELESERDKALGEQDFELAAALRDLIKNKEDSK